MLQKDLKTSPDKRQAPEADAVSDVRSSLGSLGDVGTVGESLLGGGTVKPSEAEVDVPAVPGEVLDTTKGAEVVDLIINAGEELGFAIGPATVSEELQGVKASEEERDALSGEPIEDGYERIESAALEELNRKLSTVEDKLKLAEQGPIERYGKDALKTYKGIEDKDLRVSLMKLYCWGREAKERGLNIEYVRLCLVQIERLCNEVSQGLEIGAFANNRNHLFNLYREHLGYDPNHPNLDSICFYNNEPYVDRNKLRGDRKYVPSPSLDMRYNYISIAAYKLSGIPKFNYYKFRKKFINLRNTGSHHSISYKSFEEFFILENIHPGSYLHGVKILGHTKGMLSHVLKAYISLQTWLSEPMTESKAYWLSEQGSSQSNNSQSRLVNSNLATTNVGDKVKSALSAIIIKR